MICPYCRAELEAEAAVACERCSTPVHATCAELHGKCVTFGCDSTRLVSAPAVQARGVLATPPASLSLRARRGYKEAVALALAPFDDFALAALAAAGLVQLVMAFF